MVLTEISALFTTVKTMFNFTKRGRYIGSNANL